MSEPGQRWAVVGGGMLGLTLAHRLAQHGHSVTVFEAAEQVGGLASAWTVGDVTWDRHYHVTLLSDAHLRAILDELGLDAEVEWVKTRTGLFADGALWSVSSSIDFARLPVLGVADRARLAATILRASRTGNWRRLEQIPVADWLQRWSGRRAYDRFWLPLLRAKLGEAYRETSAAFIWATAQRLYAARRSGLKEEMFGYVPGGYARVLARFVEVLEHEGVELELGSRVREVAATPDGGVTIELLDRDTARFDQVVVTVNPGLAARMCSGLAPRERALLEGVRYQGIVCASVLLDRPLAGYYLTYITDDTPITGIVEMSAMVDRRHFGGKTLVYLPRYVAPDDPLLTRSDDEIAATFLPALRTVYPESGDVQAFKVSRVREVFPVPTIGYSTRVPPTSTTVPGLHLVSSANIVNGTLNVNETVELAERTARRLVTLPAPNRGVPEARSAGSMHASGDA
jgi:protoporphyrinogen oxidase